MMGRNLRGVPVVAARAKCRPSRLQSNEACGPEHCEQKKTGKEKEVDGSDFFFPSIRLKHT